MKKKKKNYYNFSSLKLITEDVTDTNLKSFRTQEKLKPN